MSSDYTAVQPTPSFITRAQGYILIVLIVLVIGILAWNIFKPSPRYAYKVISVQAQYNNRPAENTLNQKNAADLTSTSVTLKDEELSILGSEGWELVGTFLEVETTHPNFGSSEYVTGLQPNVRPQKVVLLFKKQL